MKFYRVYLADTMIGRDGLSYWTQEGEAIQVGGIEMVQMPHAIVPAGGFHPSKEAAIQTAAEHVERLGHRLIEQARRMRTQAAEGGGA